MNQFSITFSNLARHELRDIDQHALEETTPKYTTKVDYEVGAAQLMNLRSYESEEAFNAGFEAALDYAKAFLLDRRPGSAVRVACYAMPEAQAVILLFEDVLVYDFGRGWERLLTGEMSATQVREFLRSCARVYFTDGGNETHVNYIMKKEEL